MRFLIIYGTGEGQTRKIARYMEEILEDAGHKGTIADATQEPPAPEKYDLILIGSSIHMHRYHNAVRDYIMNHKETLNHKKAGFFSVSLAMASAIEEEHEEVHEIADDFLEYTGWRAKEIWHLAGALKYTRYDYFKRLVMRLIAKRQGGDLDASRDHEYTNWDTVRKLVLDFAAVPIPG